MVTVGVCYCVVVINIWSQYMERTCQLPNLVLLKEVKPFSDTSDKKHSAQFSHSLLLILLKSSTINMKTCPIQIYPSLLRSLLIPPHA